MNAIFYVQKQENEPDSPIAAHFDLAAKIAADCYRQGQRVFIYTENKTDAHLIDEYLWQFEANSFVPHNLQGLIMVPLSKLVIQRRLATEKY